MGFLISELDRSIVEKLPLSLQITTDEISFDELPEDIQYIIKSETETVNDVVLKNPDDIYDILPAVSAYNDFITLDIQNTVIEYFKNYITIFYGTYPFDVSFGSNVKKSVNSKDTSLQKTLLGNELKNIASEISNLFGMRVKIDEINIFNSPKLTLNNFISTEFNIEIKLKIEDIDVTLNQIV